MVATSFSVIWTTRCASSMIAQVSHSPPPHLFSAGLPTKSIWRSSQMNPLLEATCSFELKPRGEAFGNRFCALSDKPQSSSGLTFYPANGMEIDSFCGKACGKADADAQKTSENRAFLQTALLLVLPAHLLGLYAVGGKSFKKDFLARLKGHGRLS